MANPGIVHGVLEGIKETPYGGVELSLQVQGADRKGRPTTSYVDARIDKFEVEKGLHNAFRPYLGKEVFVPCLFGFYQKEKGATAYDQVDVTGAPLRLQAAAPAPAVASTGQPSVAKTA
ncbi:hypothetical protein [Pseudomonas sp.]|uniref:hypothetical protein n=1 Tax=Pseudomonas sp. TaxID=306 RepID=UPI002733D7AC|nr:hypothetical protein [Pseudomonas sp.]MDP2746602.1 hypothetical protein [Pseudomonas sp.]